MSHASDSDLPLSPAWKKPQFWIGIAFSLGCLAAIAFFVDEQAVLAAAKSADYRWLALSLVAQALYLWLRAVRWRYMLANQISTEQTFHVQNIGYMLTSLLPLRVGEVARVVLLKGYPPLTIAQGLSSVVLERIVDLLTVLAVLPIAVLSLTTLPDWLRGSVRLMAVLAVVAIVIVIVAANTRPLITRIVTAICDKISFLNTQKWVERVDGLLQGLVTLTSIRSGATLLLLTVVTWGTVIVSYQLGMFAFGLRPTYLQAAFVMCAAALSLAAPSSPGAIGVFHAGVIGAITVIGWDEAQATSYAFLYHAMLFSFNVLLGLIGLARTQTSFGGIVRNTRSFLQK